MGNAVLSQVIEEIARRADALGLIYFRADITHVEDDGYTFVMLKNYVEPHMAATAHPIRRNAVEMHYIHPKAFSNPRSTDTELCLVLEQGYIEEEIIPHLNCVVRVIIRRAELFAIISPDDKIMFADSIRDADQNIFYAHFKGK